MRVPLSWLRDYVPLEMPVAELVHRLSISAAEVNTVEPRGPVDQDGNHAHFLVGRVLEAGKHPNADRLQLCQVDVGEGEPRQIVCGAWNFGAGATVAVALPGARLPGAEQPLGEAKLRGEVSRGMILSERELELGADHGGILLLPEAEPGTPLADVLPLADAIMEVEPTGNRVDLLSVYGLAREVAALFRLELEPPPGNDSGLGGGSEQVQIAIDDLVGCPRYIGRTFTNVRVAPSPPWLRARIAATGMRPISNVVDVTNYVMLALGNPIHAFDRATLAQDRIVVRRAAAGEKLRTLDGTERELVETDLVIADGKRAVALAGIMGGEETEVRDTTTEVLLEAANFEPVGLLRTSERLKLRTEGSNRWEKGVDPHLAPQAAALATQLLVELTGAGWVGHTDVHGELPERAVIRLRPERVDRLIGLETPADEQYAILERFGFDVADGEVTVPTWRARDVTREVDLVEEIARVRLDDVPFTLPVRRAMFGSLSPVQRLRRRVEDVLVGLGLAEIYTPSLVPTAAEPDGLTLPDPVGDQATLRTTLLHGLVETARRNESVGNEQLAFFEIARVYLPRGSELPEEHLRVAGLVEGGFGRVKGVVEALYGALKVELSVAPAAKPFLYPGRAAETEAGWLGELHPDLLEGRWGAIELDVDILFARSGDPVQYEDVITFPPVKQDLAFVVDVAVPAEALFAAAREAAGPELREVGFLSDFREPPIPDGKKSLAFRVEFRSPERTLSDDDVAPLRERIVTALAEQFGAELRA